MRRAGVLIVCCAFAGCVADGGEGTSTAAEVTTTVAETTSPTTGTDSTTAPGSSTTETLEALGGTPCPDSEFTCVTLEMPLDHFDPSNQETIGVTFAVLPAPGTSRGAFVTATGGPGSSGIAVADTYTSLYDPAIAEQYDIVFFDQRGIGSSGGLNCPEAAAAYYRAPYDTVSAAGLNLLIESARIFSTDCIEEMGDPQLLAHVGTDQAVEDLEVFRQAFGFDEFVLFGESYGTQLGQAFAAAHPESLDRLIIDGVVDLTLDGITYHQQLAMASSRTLDLVLEACDEDEFCSADMGMPAGEAYDRLYATLLEGDLEVDFPLPDGGTESRRFGLSDLELVAGGHLYEEYDRMLFLRALAAQAGRGDLVPFLRLLYVNLAVDPVSEKPIEDPTWSDAMYYGVECLDYRYPGETPEETVEAILAGAPDPSMRLSSTYYGDLPCAFWPYRGQAERPPPLTAEGIPVLVLGSTVDPVTPYEQGVEVHGRLAEGHIISKEGGPHVIFGWGEICPDADVTAFILDGTPPSTTTCQGEVIGLYQPLFWATPADDAETLLDTVEWEVAFLPEYYYWDGFTDTAAGCAGGGSISFSAMEDGDEFSFDDCAFSDQVSVSGQGFYDWENDLFTMDVSIAGCDYGYERTGEEYTVESSC